MRRFFIDPQSINGKQVTITGPESRHLSLVLRLKTGSQVELFDGTGMIHQATIQVTGKNKTTATITSSQKIISKPPYLTLALALSKGKKMDLVIQKACELGVSSVYPFVSDNCVVTKVTKSTQGRWQRIAHESCKQCGRATPMQIESCSDFSHLVSNSDLFDKKIIFWEKERTTNLASLTKTLPITSLLITTGPEGGFSSQEISHAEKYNFSPFSLGKRILRAETAAITAISISQFVLGNLDHLEEETQSCEQ